MAVKREEVDAVLHDLRCVCLPGCEKDHPCVCCRAMDVLDRLHEKCDLLQLAEEESADLAGEAWERVAWLERILAVERGDEEYAPDGWGYRFDIPNDDPWPDIRWEKNLFRVWRGPTALREPLRWVWFAVSAGEVGVEYPTALEAMEAVDAREARP